MSRCALRLLTLPFLSFCALGMLGACAHLPENSQEETLSLTNASRAALPSPVAFEQQQGLAPYEGQASQKSQVEWMACKIKDAKTAVMLVHGNREINNPKTFCAGWQAQAFLGQGVEVMAVNRPGFGQSTGSRDFAGKVSLAAMAKGLDAAMAAKALSKPVSGVWGYGSAVVAAGLFARQHGKLQFMLLGGGFYDLDEVRKSSSDENAKQEVLAIVKAGGEKALEDRSIAYEVGGFPKSIIVYHGKNDSVAPLQQAKAFTDTLATSGYNVKFHLIDGMDHNLPPRDHRHILIVLAHTIAQEK